MDLHKTRYRIKVIDLSDALLTPREEEIANAKIITFVRFAQKADGRYPQHMTNDSFQIALDDSEEFIPFKPNDSVKAVGAASFSKLKYRNLVPVEGYVILMISYDICVDNQRPDITFPLKNSMEPETQSAKWHTALVGVPNTTDTNVFQLVVPAATMILVHSLNVFYDINTAAINYYAGLFFNNNPLKVFARIAGISSDIAEIEWDPANPMEIINAGLGAANLDIRIYHAAGGGIDFGFSISYSLLPINANSNPPHDVRPLT